VHREKVEQDQLRPTVGRDDQAESSDPIDRPFIKVRPTENDTIIDRALSLVEADGTAVAGRIAQRRPHPRSSKGPPAAEALLSHQADGFIADLCRIKVRLTVGKPYDDFCGLLPIGVGPQIKRGNDVVESL
jgi:hypothetical protein